MKTYLVALIVLSLIIISGATGCPSTTTTTQTQAAGLDVQFSKDAPPVSINVNQEFPIYLDVTNRGGDYVQKGDAKFYLTGIGPNIQNINPALTNDITFNKESTTPSKLIFADKARFIFALQSLLVLPLALTDCYSYGTTTQANICVAGSNQSAICSLGGDKIASDSNSVAPVQISSLTESVSGSTLKMTFTISNKLGGQIYLQNADCDKLLKTKDYTESSKNNKVNIELRTPEKGLVCHLEKQDFPYETLDSLTGASDVGNVVCEMPVGGEDHVSPIYIILRYKYVSSMTKNLNVLP